MERRATIFALIKGLATATLATLAGMALLAGVVVLTAPATAWCWRSIRRSRRSAFALGAAAAVGFGGRRGL